MRAKRHLILLVVVMITAAACAVQVWATDYYVDEANGSDSNSGASPASAWKTITHALIAVHGTQEDPATIHVAAGRYSQDTNGEQFPLVMTSYTTLKGESRSSTRIVAQGRQNQVVQCLAKEQVFIEGLTITGGNARGEGLPYSSGGGICCIDSSLMVSDCVVSNNRAAWTGGCIYVSGAKPVQIVDCQITGGSVSRGGGGIAASGAILEVRGCTLSNGGGGSYGGSIYSVNSNLKVRSCVISDGHVYFGGGIAVSGGTCEVINTQIFDHVVSMAGGGIYASDCELILNDSSIRRCAVYGWGGAISALDNTSVKISNCILTDNWASGGALYGRGSTFALNCCTLVDNETGILGGMYLDSGSVKAKNCILWGSSDKPLDGSGLYDISYCDVRGGYEGKGNFDLDPMFVAGPRGEYCLCSRDAGQMVDSPCIDAGLGTAEQNSMHAKTTRTDGVPDTGKVDIGYHYAAEIPQMDRYVDPAKGDDANSGTSREDAFRTIHFAIENAVYIDARVVTIHLGPGTYSTATNGEQFPFAPQRGVHIIGAGCQDTVIDAGGTGQWVFHLERPDEFELEGVTITGGGNAFTCGGNCAPVIKNCVMSRNEAGLFAIYSSPVLQDCILAENRTNLGPAVQAGFGSSVRLIGCTITGHNCWSGPILVDMSGEVLLDGCVAYDNHVEGEGGVIKAQSGGRTTCFNSLFYDNSAERGGVIASLDPNTPVDIRSCTFYSNHAVLEAGAVFSRNGDLNIENSIFWENGDEIKVKSGRFSVRYSCVQGGFAGQGNIDADPLFVSGPLGNFYLSSRDAGQDEDSPCIDGGSVSSSRAGLDLLTTRSDEVLDTGVLDIGYHYRIPGLWIRCLLNGSEFDGGDLIVTGLALENNEDPIYVDLYAALVLPDGSIMCYDGASWRFGIHPWFSNLFLEMGFAAGPDVFSTFAIPENTPTGQYLFVGVLTKPGTTELIAGDRRAFTVN